MIGDIFQPTHLLFVLVVALLVLGPKRLPEVGRSLGRGLRDFRAAMSGDELHESLTSSTPPATTTPTNVTTEPADVTTTPTEATVAPEPEPSTEPSSTPDAAAPAAHSGRRA